MASSSRSTIPDEPWDLVVAEVGGAHGLKGVVKFRPLTDYPDRLGELDAVMLETDQGEIGVRRIEWVKLDGPRPLMRIEGIDDRAQAASLRGARLKIRRSAAAPLPPGHYYLTDIVGMRVMTTAGDDLGEITEVIRGPANDVYVTPRAMIPAVKEIVLEIDVEQRLMTVEPISGLTGE